MSHTIPDVVAGRLKELEQCLDRDRLVLADLQNRLRERRGAIQSAEDELRGINLVIKAFMPDGEDTPAPAQSSQPAREGRRSYRELALQVVQDPTADRLTAEEIANTISARSGGQITHKPRIAAALIKLQGDGLVRQAEDGTWWPVEIPPAAPPAVEADPGPRQAALEQPQEAPLPRKGSRDSTSPLKRTNPAKPKMTVEQVRNYLARSGDLGEFQIDHANADDGLMTLIASGEVDVFREDPNGPIRYRLRQPQPETPE